MALRGIKVVEFAGLAPGPFAGLILADWGASVTRIDRVGGDTPLRADILCRGKRSIALNLQAPRGVDIAKKLIAQADVLIDPFRLGVLEKLGLGPDVFLAGDGLNPRLIYARIFGFEKDRGPYQNMAGHDLNYIAASGVLAMLPSGKNGVPEFPLNLLADFAGGGELCALGIFGALFERERSGRGQIVETNMVSGARYISSYPLLHKAFPPSLIFAHQRGENLLDGGLPVYSVYQCRDGGWMSVACLEPQFYQTFLKLFLAALPANYQAAGFAPGFRPTTQMLTERHHWPDLRKFLEAGFASLTRDDWEHIFAGSDACAVPVLSPSEAAARAGSVVPQPHPHLSRTPQQTPGDVIPLLRPGRHTFEVLSELGFSSQQSRELEFHRIVGTVAPGPKL